MQIQEPIVIKVDIKKSSYINQPEVTQNDSNTFLIDVLDDGLPLDLTDVSSVTIAHTRLDRKVIITYGEITGTNQVKFVVDRPETSVIGRVDAVIQLYTADSRVSTLSFTYKVNADPTANYVPSASEKTLIEVVLQDAPVIIEQAVTATDEANFARDEALIAVEDTILATDNANLKAQLADEKATLANTAAENANGKATLADTSATNADEKAGYAQTQGDYAKEQGDYVQEVLDLQWFPVRVQKFTSTENQSVFTLNNHYAVGQNRLQIFVGGVPQFAPLNFSETSTNSFTLSEALPADLEVVAITQ